MILSFYPILRKHSLSFFSFSLWLSLGFFPVHAKPQGIPESLIQLVLPREGEEVVSKKPLIRCLIKEPFRPEKLLVLLDGVDISALLSVTPEGFEYRPLGVLVPGNHTLSVIAYTTDGKELKREFTFSTRHSKPFEEVYSGNEVTFLYEKLLGNSEESTDQPSWRTESNLASESKLRQEGWEFVFKTNVRHFDQHLRVLPPLEKGFSLVNYLFQGKHMGKGFSFLGETGDIQVTETSNTVQGLARRGASLAIQSRDLHLQLRSFVVKSE